MQSYLIAFDPQQGFFQNGSQSSQALLLLYQLSLCNILNILLSFQQSSWHLARSRFYFKKPSSLFIHKKQLIGKVLPWDWNNWVTSSGSTSNLSSLAISTTSANTSSTEALNPLKSSMKAGISFSQTSVNIDTLTYFHESQMFLMASRMVTLSQKDKKYNNNEKVWSIARSIEMWHRDMKGANTL